MKFLFVDATHNAWGMEQHLIALATGLADAGHEVHAIVQRDSPVHKLLAPTPVHVIPMKIGGAAHPRTLRAIYKVAMDKRPDWLLANQSRLYWPLCVLGWMTGARVILFRHLLRVKKWSTRVVLPRLVDRFVVMSRFAREHLVGEGAPAHRVSTMYNPIDVRRFRPDPLVRREVREELGIREDEILIGYAGRIEGAKGACVLRTAVCAAMDRMPQLNMLWIGEGKEREGTRLYAAQQCHAARHRFLGWRPDVERYFAALDMLVMPSIEPETFGRVSAEAQACAVPVIASALGGLFETMIPEKTGMLVAPNDPNPLQAAIMTLAANPALRRRLGEAGRRFIVSNYSSPVICRDLINNLQRMDAKAAPLSRSL